MALKSEQTCTRCNSKMEVVVESVEEALAAEKAVKARSEGVDELTALVEKLKADGKMPDLFVVQKDGTDYKVVAQTVLCEKGQKGEKAKRACAPTVANFVEQFTTLPPRKERTKKAEATETDTESTQ